MLVLFFCEKKEIRGRIISFVGNQDAV